MIQLKKAQDNISKRLNEMVKKSNDTRGFLNRVIYPMYQKAQIQRWMTENSSEGGRWKALDPKYAAWKKRAYSGGTRYKFIGGRGEGRPWQAIGTWPVGPGRGEKILIASGRLVGSSIGPNDQYTVGVDDHRKIVTAKTLKVFTVVDYAKTVAEDRPFMKFSQKTIREMRKAYAKYVGGK